MTISFTSGKLNLVIALIAEAKPLIVALNLKKMLSITEFPVYANKLQNIHLIISGIGTVKSAAATSFLHSITGRNRHGYYLNVGIAGSREFDLGEIVLSHKIIDQSSKQAWYPTLPSFLRKQRKQIKKKISKGMLTTALQPTFDYPEQGLVDMEASGFFIIARQLVTQEHVQIIKLISDNPQKSYQEITADLVNNLIINQLPTILWFIEECLNLSSIEKALNDEPSQFDQFIKKWHFTQYQQTILRELLRRCSVISNPDDDHDIFQAANRCVHPKQVIKFLTDYLDQTSYRW